MLRQLLHRLRPALHADFVAVELSDTFQSLSQRIEAMKHYRTWSARQMALAGSMLALLAAITIVPWRVVAQEGKPPAKSTEPAATDKSNTDKSNTEKTPADKAAVKTPEQLLIGAWRMGISGTKFTIRDDGTYEYSLPSMNAPVIESPTGHWKLVGQQLVTTADPSEDEMGNEREPKSYGFTIIRLDDSFLRLQQIEIDRPPTIFYRRVTDLKPLETIADKVSPEILKLAQLLKLDSEEALALDAWNKESQIIDKASLDVIERLDAADQEKIDLNKLFQFTPDEAKAYESLTKINNYGLSYIQGLGEEGLLAAEELSAVKRMTKFAETFDRILRGVNPEVPGRPGFGGMGMGGMRPTAGQMMNGLRGTSERPTMPRGEMGGEFGGGRGGMVGPPRSEAKKAGKKSAGDRTFASEYYEPGKEPLGPDGKPLPALSEINPRARDEALTKLNAYLQELAAWLARGPFK
jgi:hypothetical protein